MLFPPRRTFAAWSVALLVALPQAPSFAVVNDILPGDYAVPQRDFRLLSIYNYERNSHYVASPTTEHNLSLQTILFGYVSGRSALPYAVTGSMNYAAIRAEAGTPRRKSGWMDSKFSLTTWPVVEANFSFALGLTHQPPTGKYRPEDAINTGQNRHRTALNAGLALKAVPFAVDQSFELASYQDNKDFGAARVDYAQQDTFASTTYFRYANGSSVETFLGYYQASGGSVSVNNINTTTTASAQRASIGLRAPLLGWFGVVRYTTDLERQAGLKTEHELLVRFSKPF